MIWYGDSNLTFKINMFMLCIHFKNQYAVSTLSSEVCKTKSAKLITITIYKN